jgi:hypothetical protein
MLNQLLIGLALVCCGFLAGWAYERARATAARRSRMAVR